MEQVRYESRADIAIANQSMLEALQELEKQGLLVLTVPVLKSLTRDGLFSHQVYLSL